MCWNSNLIVQRNNVKKTVEHLVFRLFWILTRKKCVFAGKFLAGLSKILSTCLVEQLQSEISECKSWKLEYFWIIFEVFGTMAEHLFQGWQNSNRCPREQFMKFSFQKRIVRYFFRFWANVYFQRKFRQSCETRNLCIRGSFWGKTIFEKYITFHTFFGLWFKKRLVGRKFFPRSSQLQSAHPEAFSEKK